jgi:hypothetical protein
MVEDLVDGMFLPAFVLFKNEITNSVVVSVVRFFTPNSASKLFVNPFVFPYVNELSIPNISLTTFFEDPASFVYTMPRVAHVLGGFCFQNITVWVVFCL